MSVKVVGLDRAVGQELTSWHFSVGAEYLLLQFTGGECCQISAQGSSGDDPWLEESRPFCWRDYDEHALVNSGVLTAEWVATQNAEMLARREAEKRARDLDTLAELKAKYEPKPGTLNGKTLQQMIDDMVAQAVKDKGLAKAQAIVDALPPEHRDLVWQNGMATNSEARTPASRDANGETAHE